MNVNMKNATWKMDDYQKSLKKEKNRKNIRKNLKRVRLMSKVFAHATVKSMFTADTMVFGTVLGLVQGLKYNGNFKRGLTTGVVTIAVMGIVNGISTVASAMEKINEVAARED